MNMGQNTGWSRKRLAALAADTAGNTMLLMAAALFPIIGMAGSAFDMSRAYMVKTRLQQACDAGVLAGRRTMTTSTFDSASENQANNFFNNNFPDQSFGTSAVSFDANGTADGQVAATASAIVPMTLMKIFAVPSLTMSVECDARLDVANTDVMFVLDVTGSMATTDASGSGTRLEALQGAVMQFYDTLDAAVSSDARLRFGFVPYSSAVNITNILPDLPDDYLADNWTYRTKIANYNTPEYVADPVTTVNGPIWQYYDNGNTGISQSNCLRYMKNQSFGSYSPEATNQGGPAPTPTKVISFPHDGTATSGDEWGYTGSPVNGASSKSCRRKRTTTTTTYATWYERTNWEWGSENFDTSVFKNRTSVTLARSGDGRVKVAGKYNAQELVAAERENVSTSDFTWNGCIEERKTRFDTAWKVSAGEISPKNLDGDAWDLNIDGLPIDADESSKWGPAWDDITYRNNNSNTASNYCPVSMLKLADDNERSRASVQTYINSLTPVGSTYHDIGLMWGARLISPTGIFKASNENAPNGRAIDRNIVFMTDGKMEPSTSIYASYGLEDHDKRIIGSGSMNSTELAARHNARLQAICDALKQRNITLWVVSYSLAVTPELATCSPDKTYAALNKEALNNVFRDIAKRIAQLRLTK